MDILTNVVVHADKPIQDTGQDILGRQAFADRLVDIIDGYIGDCKSKNGRDGLVIGLEGNGREHLFFNVKEDNTMPRKKVVPVQGETHTIHANFQTDFDLKI